MTTPQPASERPAQTLDEAFLATHALHVLVAEDNEYMLDLLEGTLRREGYKVTSVTDGNGAFGDAEIHAQAERLGAQVLDKPFLLDDLRAAVRDHAIRCR